MADLNTDLTAFIEKAEAATPQGAWKVERGVNGQPYIPHVAAAMREPNAAHIAQCSPSVAIALARVALAAETAADTRCCFCDGKYPFCIEGGDNPCSTADVIAALAALSVALEENNG